MPVVEHVIRPLRLVTRDQLATHGDAAFGETDLPANLCGFVPAGLNGGGDDVLGTNVGFVETSCSSSLPQDIPD
jgi:hypothetical protein